MLSLAATRVASLEHLEPLHALPSLFDLALDDVHYGAAPVAELDVQWRKAFVAKVYSLLVVQISLRPVRH